MKSPQISKDNIGGLALSERSESKGFTLIEIIIVMSIIVILGGLGLFYGFDNLWRQSFRSNRDSLISALERARAESISNICLGENCTEGKSHGVYIDQDNKRYIIFQGDHYKLRDPDDIDQDVVIKADYDITYPDVREVVFERLSGDIIRIDDEEINFNSEPKDWEMSLKDNVTGNTSIIGLNIEGQISWKE